MEIKYNGEGGIIESIALNGHIFEVEENESVNIPSSLLNDFPTNELHPQIQIQVCDKIEEGMIHVGPVQYSLRRLVGNSLQIDFEEFGRRKYWDGEIGYKIYMETKRAIIQEREKEVGDIMFANYDDDGDYITLTYKANVESDRKLTVLLN